MDASNFNLPSDFPFFPPVCSLTKLLPSEPHSESDGPEVGLYVKKCSSLFLPTHSVTAWGSFPPGRHCSIVRN